MRKNEIPDIFVGFSISLCKGAKTRVRVDSAKFGVNVGMRQGSVLSPLVFAVVLHVVTELARDCVLIELMYGDYIGWIVEK